MIKSYIFFGLMNAITFSLDVGYYGTTMMNRNLTDATSENGTQNQLELCYFRNKNEGVKLSFECFIQGVIDDNYSEMVYYIHMLEKIRIINNIENQLTNPCYVLYSRTTDGIRTRYISLQYFLQITVYDILLYDFGRSQSFIMETINNFIIFVENNTFLSKSLSTRNLDTVEANTFLIYNTPELVKTLSEDFYEIVKDIKSNESKRSDEIALLVYNFLEEKLSTDVKNTEEFSFSLDAEVNVKARTMGLILCSLFDLEKIANLIYLTNKNNEGHHKEMESIEDVVSSLERCLILEVYTNSNINLSKTEIFIHGDQKEHSFLIKCYHDDHNKKLVIPCKELFTCYKESLTLRFKNGDIDITLDIKPTVDNIKNRES